MNEFAEPSSVRSTRVLAVTTLWISRTLSALVVACPLVLAIQATGIASGPARDAPLFRAGALVLIEALRVGAPALAAAVKVGAVLFGLSAVLGLVPLGTVLELLRERTALFFWEKVSRAMRVWPRFAGLGVIALLAVAALLLACSLLSGVLAASLHRVDERAETVAPFAVFGLGLLGSVVIAAVHDLARALVVSADLGVRQALLEALELFRARSKSLLLGVYPSASATVGAWLTAALVLTRLELTSSRSVALAFVIHQTATVLALIFRVRFLELTLELAEESARQ